MEVCLLSYGTTLDYLSTSLDIPFEFTLWAFLSMPTWDSNPWGTLSAVMSSLRTILTSLGLPYLKMIPAFISSPDMGSPPCLCIILSPGWWQSSLHVNTMQMFFNIQLDNTCFVILCLAPGSAMALSSLTRSARPVSPLLPSHSVGLCMSLSLLSHLPSFYGKSLFYHLCFPDYLQQFWHKVIESIDE